MLPPLLSEGSTHAPDARRTTECQAGTYACGMVRSHHAAASSSHPPG